MLLVRAAIASFVLASSLVLANASPVKALVCTLDAAYTSVFEDGRFSSQAANDTMQFVYASIDIPNRSAQFIGNAGAVSVTALAEGNKLVFIERTDTGNYTMTSVAMIGDKYPVVHSRQMFLPFAKMSISSIYNGFCEARY